MDSRLLFLAIRLRMTHIEDEMPLVKYTLNIPDSMAKPSRLELFPEQKQKTPDFSNRGAKMPKVYLFDYVAGNIRSLVNAIEKVGFEVEWIRCPEDLQKAEVRKRKQRGLPIPLLS